MNIAIYEDHGGELHPDDYAPVSVYADGEWLVDEGGYEPYYPAGTDPAAIADQVDGPAAVAVVLESDPSAVAAEVGVEKAWEKSERKGGPNATIRPLEAETLADFEVTVVDDEGDVVSDTEEKDCDEPHEHFYGEEDDHDE